eukprot:SAG22_NODE_8670_length_637_cov_2.022305_1_plen_117_part_00
MHACMHACILKCPECKTGGILLNFNRVVALFQSIGPIGAVPQLQLLVLFGLWCAPLSVKGLARGLLLSHALLAWSMLDVWVVALGTWSRTDSGLTLDQASLIWENLGPIPPPFLKC